MLNATETLIAVRVRLLFDAPFFGVIGTALELKEDPDLNPPTMATDGKWCFFHPDFVTKTSRDHLKGVMVHEILHVILMHHLRRGSRDPKLWNIACDYAVNLLVKDNGYQLPSGCLYEEEYREWSAEKIYAYLYDNPDKQPQGGGGAGNVGQVLDAGTGGEKGEKGSAPPLTAEQTAAEEGKVKAQIQAALAQAKKAGKTGGGIERLVKDLCEPKAPWREILYRFVNEQAFSDWDYSRSHTRILHDRGIITPVLGGEKLGHLAMIIDTSGSVNEKELTQFGGEISSILENLECKVTVIYIDTKIRKVEEYTSEDLPLRLTCTQGGGTRQKAAYEYVEEFLAGEVSALIAYTDSFYFDWNEIAEPSMPALMACTSSHLDRDVPDWIQVIDISD